MGGDYTRSSSIIIAAAAATAFSVTAFIYLHRRKAADEQTKVEEGVAARAPAPAGTVLERTASPTEIVMANQNGLLLTSLLQRLIPFVFNQYMWQATHPEILGRVTISFELWLSFLLFFREGVRLTCLQEKGNTTEEMQLFINLSWIPSIVIIIIGVLYYISCSLDIIKHDSNEVKYLCLYMLSALIESIGEPWVNSNVYNSDLLSKPRAESFALLMKPVVTFILVSRFDLGLIGFGFSQLCYSFVYLIALIFISMNSTCRSFSSYMPSFVRPPPSSTSAQGSATYFLFLSQASAWTSFWNTCSSLLKQFLTEADKIVLTLSVSAYEQGIFAFASNYGAIVARILFFPYEETSKVAFSKVHNLINKYNAVILAETGRGAKADAQENIKVNIIEIFTTLQKQLLTILFIASIFIIFGFNYVRAIANIFLNSQWKTEETISTLEFYCIYICVMGVNGISEAFVNATMESTAWINTGFILSSICFGTSSYFLHRLDYGTSGIVLALSASMSIRILFSCFYIQRYLSKRKTDLLESCKQSNNKDTEEIKTQLDIISFSSLVPKISFFAIVIAIFATNLLFTGKYIQLGSNATFADSVKHICIGGILGIVYLTAIFIYYDGFRLVVATLLRQVAMYLRIPFLTATSSYIIGSTNDRKTKQN